MTPKEFLELVKKHEEPHKSLKRFHAGFYVNVCKGDVDCAVLDTYLKFARKINFCWQILLISSIIILR